MNNIESGSEYIINRFNDNDIEIDKQKAGQLFDYYSMMVEKNKVMNLTSITEFKDVVDKHFIDSCVLVKFASINNKSVIDIGTGAGFPGVPLKILCPDIKITLLDSLRKRIDFLNEVIAALDLKGVETIHGRAEDLARKTEFREKYDIAVSRAVSNLSTLSEYCLPFVAVNGAFYSYKGIKASDEISAAEKAIKILGGKITDNYKPDINGTDYDRTIIKISKIIETPKKYPRSGNKPSTDPVK